MNGLYFLNRNPKLCAQYQPDEVLRLGIHRLYLFLTDFYQQYARVRIAEFPERLNLRYSYPMLVEWTSDNVRNYKYLVMLLNEMLDEYKIRFGEDHKVKSNCHHFSDITKFGLDYKTETLKPVALYSMQPDIQEEIERNHYRDRFNKPSDKAISIFHTNIAFLLHKIPRPTYTNREQPTFYQRGLDAAINPRF